MPREAKRRRTAPRQDGAHFHGQYCAELGALPDSEGHQGIHSVRRNMKRGASLTAHCPKPME